MCFYGVLSVRVWLERYDVCMKPLPAPNVPGNTEAERFDNAVRKTFTVSKEEIERREAEWQRTHRETKPPRQR